MGSFFKWIKECFNYYVFQDIGQELINQINQSDSQVLPSVKQDLIASIMMNKPEDFQEHIKNAPTELQEDLMNRLMRASKMYSSPIEKHDSPSNLDLKSKFDRVIEQLKSEQKERSMKQEHQRFMDAMKKPCNRVIHIGQIIPSDQFAPVHVKPRRWHDPVIEFPNKNWHTVFNRVMRQLKFKQFIKVCRYNKMEHLRCLEAQKHPENVIHTGQIIPSDQFTHPMSTIYWHDLEVTPVPMNWHRAFKRVLEQFKFKQFIKVCRYNKMEHLRCLEAQKHPENVIHTGQIIPSDQFIHPMSAIYWHDLEVTPVPMNWHRAFKRVMRQLKFKQFIKVCRYNKMEHLRCLEAQKQNQVIHTGKLIRSGQFVPTCSIVKSKPLIDMQPICINLDRCDKFREFRKSKRQERKIIHTGKIIPSGQFKPVSTPIRRKPLHIPIHYLDGARLYNRCMESLKLKNHIRICRAALYIQETSSFTDILKEWSENAPTWNQLVSNTSNVLSNKIKWL